MRERERAERAEKEREQRDACSRSPAHTHLRTHTRVQRTYFRSPNTSLPGPSRPSCARTHAHARAFVSRLGTLSRTHAHTDTRTHTRTHAHTRTHTHTHTHTGTQVQSVPLPPALTAARLGLATRKLRIAFVGRCVRAYVHTPECACTRACFCLRACLSAPVRVRPGVCVLCVCVCGPLLWCACDTCGT